MESVPRERQGGNKCSACSKKKSLILKYRWWLYLISGIYKHNSCLRLLYLYAGRLDRMFKDIFDSCGPSRWTLGPLCSMCHFFLVNFLIKEYGFKELSVRDVIVSHHIPHRICNVQLRWNAVNMGMWWLWVTACHSKTNTGLLLKQALALEL